ncbi:MAG: hypothetical protein IPQ00_07375 [Chloracidobacterium sp.]|nr:hypothetical protein [Chloracidobacterium sp.]MBL0240377.1 hypothetical protein [Chloracidobacterium sp.]
MSFVKNTTDIKAHYRTPSAPALSLRGRSFLADRFARSHGYRVNSGRPDGDVEKKTKRLKKKAGRPTANLVDLVVKKATLRVPCGGRITRLIADRKET